MIDEPKVWISSRKLRSEKRSYYLRWIDLTTGKWRNKKAASDRKRAEREAAKLEIELQKGTHVDLRRADWSTFVQEVTALLEGQHRGEARSILDEFGKAMTVSSPRFVRHSTIRDFVEHLRGRGSADDSEKHRSNSVSTINKKLRYLRLAFNTGVRLELMGKNPLDGWSWQKTKRPTLRILSTDEESKLLASAEKLYGFKMRVFLRFVLETWGRFSEATGLRWEQIDFDEPSVTFLDTKSHEDRVIPIAPDSELLADLRKLQVQTLQDGGPFVAYANCSNTAQKRLAIVKDSGIAPITTHDLRRTGITRALLGNMPPVVVQRLAGHRDIKTTLRYYAEVNRDDLRRAVEKQRAATLAG